MWDYGFHVVKVEKLLFCYVGTKSQDVRELQTWNGVLLSNCEWEKVIFDNGAF